MCVCVFVGVGVGVRGKVAQLVQLRILFLYSSVRELLNFNILLPSGILGLRRFSLNGSVSTRGWQRRSTASTISPHRRKVCIYMNIYIYIYMYIYVCARACV